MLVLLFFLAGELGYRAEGGLTPSFSEYFELYTNNTYNHMQATYTNLQLHSYISENAFFFFPCPTM